MSVINMVTEHLLFILRVQQVLLAHLDQKDQVVLR